MNQEKNTRRVTQKIVQGAKKDVEKIQKMAEKEINKLKKEMEKAAKKIEDFVKKNPEKASLLSAGVGAALGAALAMFINSKVKTSKKK